MKLDIPGLTSKTVLISYTAGFVLLYLFLRNTDWAAIANSLHLVVWPLLAAAIVLRFAALAAASLRWQALLLPIRSLRLAPIFRAMLIGMAVTTGASMQAAEFARPYVLSQSEALDFTSTVSTVVVEWLLDLSAILAVFIPAVVLLRSSGANAISGGGMTEAIVLLVSIAVLGFLALRLVQHHTAGMQRFFDRKPAGIPGRAASSISEHLGHFAVGLSILRQPRGCAIITGYSFVVSILTAFSCWTALAAFGLRLPWTGAFFLLGLISLGGIIPTPAAIGGFHAICQFGLVAFFSFNSAQVILPVIGLHAVLYIPASIAGLFCLFDFGRTGKRVFT